MKSKLLLLLLLPLCMAAQKRDTVKGRVVSGASGVKNVLVINDSAQAETRTDSLGFFTIKAKTGDVFALSDYKVKPLKILYASGNIQNNIFIIQAELNATELDEIVINKDKKLSAEGLGIIPKGQAVYTNAERKVEAQAKVKVFTDTMNSNLNAAIQTDGFINRLTGRTRALKANLETERKEGIIANLNTLYTQDEITQEYKIPRDYISGFMFYVAEDTDIANYIKFKNNLGLKDRLYQLSLLYLDSINNEK